MDFAPILRFVSFVVFTLATTVGIPLPFSLPPRPEEPALLRVAPKDSIAFLSWSGAMAADPKSTNQTVQLAAEPEVRAMIGQLQAALTAFLGRGGRPADALLRQFANFGAAALQRPGCIFVQKVQDRPRRDLAAGVVLKLDDAMQGAKALMTAMDLAMAQRLHGERHEDLEIDGVRFHALPVDTEHAFLAWAEVDGWFALAVGKDTAAQIVSGLRNRDPGLQGNAGYAQLAPACSVARPSTRAFLDVQAMLGILASSGGDVWVSAFKALGLSEATAVVAIAGLEGNGFCSRLRVAVPKPAGLLAAFTRPIGQDDLIQIPLDANIALAARADASRIETGIIDLFAAFFGENVRREYDNGFAQTLQTLTGVRWREDLLARLGDAFAIWNAPSQGGAWFTGAMASIRLQDGAGFAAALQQAMATVAERAPSKAKARAAGQGLSRRGSYLDQFVHRGQSCWWIDSFDVDFPFAPAWTATPDHLLVGLMPQPLKATLDAGTVSNPDGSLLRLPEMNRRGNAVAMSYLDAKGTLALGYPALLVLLQSASGEWQREGFDFDAADLPGPAALLPHLGRELTLLEPVDGGWSLQRTGTLPIADPLTVALVIGFGAILGDL